MVAKGEKLCSGSQCLGALQRVRQSPGFGEARADVATTAAQIWTSGRARGKRQDAGVGGRVKQLLGVAVAPPGRTEPASQHAQEYPARAKR
eukprot:CAMPEP_0171157976 /NCGR_PEP_ID=MMETSP0790-20130122/2254_1 /TAXON_ID=2925 /ORGANISM="Alexandrium catenella, Strain OF101" /LENGTH=90 /DNA_ID=CAMNT_0011622365 /DNA_START=13 /DNA_END=282 /DNA_ORIENTATION=+